LLEVTTTLRNPSVDLDFYVVSTQQYMTYDEATQTILFVYHDEDIQSAMGKPRVLGSLPPPAISRMAPGSSLELHTSVDTGMRAPTSSQTMEGFRHVRVTIAFCRSHFPFEGDIALPERRKRFREMAEIITGIEERHKNTSPSESTKVR
jgi:hypothetical protein